MMQLTRKQVINNVENICTLQPNTRLCYRRLNNLSGNKQAFFGQFFDNLFIILFSILAKTTKVY